MAQKLTSDATQRILTTATFVEDGTVTPTLVVKDSDTFDWGGTLSTNLRMEEVMISGDIYNALSAQYPNPTPEQEAAILQLSQVQPLRTPVGSEEHLSRNGRDCIGRIGSRLADKFKPAPSPRPANYKPVLSQVGEAMEVLGIEGENFATLVIKSLQPVALVTKGKFERQRTNVFAGITFKTTEVTYTLDDADNMLTAPQLKKLLNLAANASADKVAEARAAAANVKFTQAQIDAVKA